MKAVFYVTIASPLSVGWYDPMLLDENFYIRPTSLKGLWRWWARAFAAGALYEAGCVGGDFFKKVHELVSRDLGLGSTEQASSYTITVEVMQRPMVEDAQRANLQRFKLLSLGKRGADRPRIRYATGGSFRISVEGDHPAFSTAVSILAVALTLSGLGKGGRKGLGSLDVVKTDGHAPRGSLPEVINKVKSSLAVRRCGEPPRLPPISAVAKGVFEVYKVNVNYQTLHNLFLRSERAKLSGSNPESPDPLGGYAWFLGLPRSGKDRDTGVTTGYLISSEKEEGGGRGSAIVRRASPVFAAWHSNKHVYGGGGYVSVFLSADWPRQIQWVRLPKSQQKADAQGTTHRVDEHATGRHDAPKPTPQMIIINEDKLQEAKAKFLKLLEKFSPTRIW
ncbi:MAG: type III-B CRISPR module RAMP protein Cmr1 [Pyrobaculum sp.]